MTTTQRITLPTPPEVRAQLNKAGWSLLNDQTDDMDCYERWGITGKVDTTVEVASWRLAPEAKGDVGRIAQFAAIVGMVPTGYRMVPDEVAGHSPAPSEGEPARKALEVIASGILRDMMDYCKERGLPVVSPGDRYAIPEDLMQTIAKHALSTGK